MIPLPMQFEFSLSECVLVASNGIYSTHDTEQLRQFTAHVAHNVLDSAPIEALSRHETVPPGSLVVALNDDSPPCDEGYELHIGDHVTLSGSTCAGLYRGLQSLRQLGNHAIHDSAASALTLPRGRVVDHPRFRWRGQLLDCVRTFQTLDQIKRVIDILAYFKLNVLHLHLSDDQGWRVEIARYPRLTEVGAYRGEGAQRTGGFYGQAELRELVRYAAERHIRIVPEIDLPGHATAAIASYPELSCTGTPIKTTAEFGILKNVLCLGNDSTFEFLENILDELADIFDAPYIHLGGDEAPTDSWTTCGRCQARIAQEGLPNERALQGFLLRRLAPWAERRGRRLIAWDEVTETDPPRQVIVQAWRNYEAIAAAAQLGHDVIASPHAFVYFDYPETAAGMHGKPDWMRVNSISNVYSFEPEPQNLPADIRTRILGAEAALWTEYVPAKQTEAYLLPRLCAFAEALWSPREARDESDFLRRLNTSACASMRPTEEPPEN